jgi:putative transposase
MGMARSTYYDRPQRAAEDTAIVEAMFAICDAFEFYGYRRVGAALRQQGLVVNHKKIRRLTREHALQQRIRRRFVTATDSDHDGPIFPNLAKDLVPAGPEPALTSQSIPYSSGGACLFSARPIMLLLVTTTRAAAAPCNLPVPR